MKIVILSDCHVGSPEANICPLDEFLATLECDKVVFAGDLWDYWEASDGELRKHKDTKARIFQLSQRGIKVEYILGNHDLEYPKNPLMSAAALPIVDEWEHTTPGGKKIKIIHGHEFDFIYKRHMILYKLSSVLNATAGRILGISMKTFRKTVTNSRGQPEYSDTVNEIHKAAQRYYLKRGYDALIMGHTHAPTYVPPSKGQIEFANSGDWKFHNSYAVIDGEEITIKTFP